MTSCLYCGNEAPAGCKYCSHDCSKAYWKQTNRDKVKEGIKRQNAKRTERRRLANGDPLVFEKPAYIDRILACRAKDGTHRLIKQVFGDQPEAVQEMLL